MLEYAAIHGSAIYPDQFPKYANAIEEGLFRKIKQTGKQNLVASFR